MFDISTLLKINRQITIEPSSVLSPAVGEQFTVDINITGGQDIRGYRLIIRYNSDKIKYVSHTSGNYLPNDSFNGPTVVKPAQKWAIEDANNDGVVDIKDLVWVNQGLAPQFSTPAEVTLNVTSPSGVGNGDGTLTTITFEVVNRDVSTFILSGSLSKTDDEQLPFIVQFGSVIEPLN